MFVVALLLVLLGPSSIASTALPSPAPPPVLSAAWLDTSPLVGALARRVGCAAPAADAPLRRARRAAWWPDVTLRGDYDRGVDVQRDAVYDTDFTSDGVLDGADARDLSRWGDGESWSFGVQLSWDLGDTRYHPDEDVWSRDVARRADTALRRADEALDVWRVRAAARRRVAAADDEADRQAAAAEIAAADAWLDTLSAGWWAAAVEALAAGDPPPVACAGAR